MTWTEVVLWCVLGVLIAFLTLVGIGLRRISGDFLVLVVLLMATASRRPDRRWVRMLFLAAIPFVVIVALYFGMWFGLLRQR